MFTLSNSVIMIMEITLSLYENTKLPDFEYPDDFLLPSEEASKL